MPVLVPDIADRCVVVNGVAKTYAMTGWRVGWIVAPEDVVNAAFNLQSHATSNVSNVAQRAALAAVSGGLDDVAKLREAFNRRRVRTHDMLSAIDGVECAGDLLGEQTVVGKQGGIDAPCRRERRRRIGRVGTRFEREKRGILRA